MCLFGDFQKSGQLFFRVVQSGAGKKTFAMYTKVFMILGKLFLTHTLLYHVRRNFFLKMVRGWCGTKNFSHPTFFGGKKFSYFSCTGNPYLFLCTLFASFLFVISGALFASFFFIIIWQILFSNFIFIPLPISQKIY